MPTRPRLTHAVSSALDDAPGWVRAALAAAEAALGSAMIVALPVLAVWLASPNTSASGPRVVALALAGWCLAHGAPVVVGIGAISIAPLLLTLLAVATAAWSAQRLAARLPRSTPRRLARAGELRGDVAVEGGAFVATYTVLGLLATLAVRSAEFAVSTPRALVGFALVGVAGYLWGLQVEFRADLGTVAPGWRRPQRETRWLTAGAAAGVRSLAWLLLTGLVVVLTVLVVRFERVAGLYDELTPGALGGLVLTGLQVLYLPNLAIWGLSWLAGPGFGVGVGSTISLTQATPGLLPLIPVLGALPEPGPLSPWLLVVLLLPVGAGVLLELRVRGTVGDDPLDRALAVGAGCAAAAVGTAMLAMLSGGSLGSARLAHVGPQPLLLAAILGGELLLGGALSLGVDLARRSLAGRPGAAPDPPSPAGRSEAADAPPHGRFTA